MKITDVRAVPGDSAFLLDDGKTAILRDTGFAFTGYQVAENIQKVLGDRPLDYIFLTHSHYDHALGAPYIVKAYPNAKVVAGTYADAIFQKPTARALMRELNAKAAKINGVTDYEDRIDELKVDISVQDGDVITCGDLQFTALDFPGHTKCSVGFYLAAEKLLLSVETLGVYYGEQDYLPAFLVGYQMALDSIDKAKMLNVERILLPHYGVVEGKKAKAYLDNSKQATIETAQTILSMCMEGKNNEEILDFLTERDYKENVRTIYPMDAFSLNTSIMIERVRKELM